MSVQPRVPADVPEGGQFASKTGGYGSGEHIEAEFKGSTEEEAQKFWVKKLEAQTLDGDGLLLSHEAPGEMTETFMRSGLREGFATVGAPSNFVTSAEKTRVWFKVPYVSAESITPDMRYDAESPHLDALRERGSLRGVDVSFNFDVPPDIIAKIEVVRNGETLTTYSGGKAGWNVAKKVKQERRDVRRPGRY